MTDATPTSEDRVPLPEDQLPACSHDHRPTPQTIDRLLRFNHVYQLRELRYFAGLRLQWHCRHRGRTFPGLCAEVDAITGKWRPLDQQRAWSWGDARALGLWCQFMQKRIIPAQEQAIEIEAGDTVWVNLQQFYADYCDDLYRVLSRRLEEHGGATPFCVDIQTNQCETMIVKSGLPTVTDVFVAHAFCQYGLWRGDVSITDRALEWLDRLFEGAGDHRFADAVTGEPMTRRTHAWLMILAGAVVDLLKSMEAMRVAGRAVDPGLSPRLVRNCRRAIEVFCGEHWDGTRGWFAEYLDPATGKPMRDARGRVICDPGHTVEGVGFFAELASFVRADEQMDCGIDGEHLIRTLVPIFRFVADHGFSPRGLMYKHIDLTTMQGTDDAQLDGVPVRTAPWWNLREFAAAAIRLFQLTGEAELWRAYEAAIDTSYRRYANLNIGALMVQTLDAESALPLPLHPATGNLDPMHSARARLRETEALQALRDAPLV